MVEEKKEEKIEEKKVVVETKKKEEKPKKEEATVKGYDLDISTKHAVAICDFIRGKSIETAINHLEDVLSHKRAVPMNLEVPHRKGIERGRYPAKATKTVIKLLKSLNANASILEIENPTVTFAKADKAARPYRRWGSKRFKRSHIVLIAKKSKENKK